MPPGQLVQEKGASVLLAVRSFLTNANTLNKLSLRGMK